MIPAWPPPSILIRRSTGCRVHCQLTGSDFEILHCYWIDSLILFRVVITALGLAECGYRSVKRLALEKVISDLRWGKPSSFPLHSLCVISRAVRVVPPFSNPRALEDLVGIWETYSLFYEEERREELIAKNQRRERSEFEGLTLSSWGIAGLSIGSRAIGSCSQNQPPAPGTSKMARRGKLWFGDGALRVAPVLAMAQLLSFAHYVRCQTAESVFCDKFAIPFGYRCREYATLTADGYVLVTHRISNQPRTTPQDRNGSPTAQAPAPLPPLCVSTAAQPFETIHDYVRDMGEPQSLTDATCSYSDPTQAQLQSVSDNNDDRNPEIEDKISVERLEPDRMSTTLPTAVGSQTELKGPQGEGVDEDKSQKYHHSSSARRYRVPDKTVRNFTTPDSPMATATAPSSKASSDRVHSNHEDAMSSRQNSPPSASSKAGSPSLGSVGGAYHKPSVESTLNPRTASSTRPAATWKSSPTSSRVTKGHHEHQHHSTGSPARSRVPRRHHGRHHSTKSATTPARSGPMTTISVSPVGVTTNEKYTDSAAMPLPEPESESTSSAAPISEPQPKSDVVEDHTPATPVSPTPPPSSSQGSHAVQGGEPVLLMHQEFQNGESWFVQTDGDTDQLLPYLLLNAGFEVWIGHQRATYYGHDHITLTPENQSYWNWTWDEHAKYDMPALLELVYSETGSAVNFVGISQSATAGAAVATMPIASSLLRSLTLIGPTMFRGNTTSRTLLAWASLLPGNDIGRAYFETAFQNGVFNLTSEFPTSTLFSGPVAAAATDVSGPNCCLGSTVVSFDNGWDGTTSMKNLLHFQQDIRTNTWSHFDYGSVQNNSKAYNGSPLPPTYNPEDIPETLPVLLIYGGKDSAAPASGSLQFMSRLKIPIGIRSAVFLPAYAHFDLLYSLNRTQDVFIPVLQFLERQRLSQ